MCPFKVVASDRKEAAVYEGPLILMMPISTIIRASSSIRVTSSLLPRLDSPTPPEGMVHPTGSVQVNRKPCENLGACLRRLSKGVCL